LILLSYHLLCQIIIITHHLYECVRIYVALNVHFDTSGEESEFLSTPSHNLTTSLSEIIHYLIESQKPDMY
jgi:hypothetical protein